MSYTMMTDVIIDVLSTTNRKSGVVCNSAQHRFLLLFSFSFNVRYIWPVDSGPITNIDRRDVVCHYSEPADNTGESRPIYS
jgi:hypothetical protein